MKKPGLQTVKVFTAKDEIEAYLIKGKLEEEGIPCVLVREVPHSLYPFTIDGLAEVKILVPVEERERAEQIIENEAIEKEEEEK